MTCELSHVERLTNPLTACGCCASVPSGLAGSAPDGPAPAPLTVGGVISSLACANPQAVLRYVDGGFYARDRGLVLARHDVGLCTRIAATVPCCTAVQVRRVCLSSRGTGTSADAPPEFEDGLHEQPAAGPSPSRGAHPRDAVGPGQRTATRSATAETLQNDRRRATANTPPADGTGAQGVDTAVKTALLHAGTTSVGPQVASDTDADTEATATASTRHQPRPTDGTVPGQCLCARDLLALRV